MAVCLATTSAAGQFSADGRYLVFSTAQSIVTNDTNNAGDVYRYDRQTGGIVLVSVNPDGKAGNADSYSPDISADGSVVAFVSDATDLSPLDQNGLTDVYVRDLDTGITTLVSVEQSASNGGNGRSYRPQISADGRRVVFESEATNLVVINDANGEATDLFLRDLVNGNTSLVTANRAGSASGNRGSSLGAISADGSTVVFTSTASDLTTNDTNNTQDVFARDLSAGVTTLVSVNLAGTGGGNADSFDPKVNSSGTIVAFGSAASDLVANDDNADDDIFVRDLSAAVTRLASVSVNGSGSANGRSFGLQFSADGKVVAFASSADDLVANDTNTNTDVFVRDLNTGVTTLVSENFTGSGSVHGRSDGVSLSANGQVVAFVSTAHDLVTNTVDGLPNLFVRNLKTGKIQLASVNHSGGGTGNPPAFFFDPALSAGGAVLTFSSLATNLLAHEVAATDVFWSSVDGIASPLPRLFFSLAAPGGSDWLHSRGILLSYSNAPSAMIEFSHDLKTWAPLNANTSVVLTVETGSATTTNRLDVREEGSLPWFFRLVQP